MRRCITWLNVGCLVAILGWLQLFDLQSKLSSVNEATTQFGVVRWGYLAFLLVSTPTLILFLTLKNQKSKVVYWSIAFLIYILISSGLHYFAMPLRELVLSFLLPAFLLLIFLVSYVLTVKFQAERILMCALMCNCAVNLLTNIYLIRLPELLVFSIYMLVSFTPIIFMTNTRLLPTLFSVIVVFLLLLSGKRTGLLAIVAAFFVYYSIQFFFIKRRSMVGSLIFIPIAILTVFFAYLKMGYGLTSYLTFFSQERYFQAIETGGSGRLELWEYIITAFNKFPFFDKLFGKGYLFFEFLWQGIFFRPHNDFLDVLGSYGVFGSIIYLGFVFSILLTALRLLRARDNLSGTLCATVIFSSMFSLTSIFIMGGTNFYPVFMYFGMVYGIIDRRERIGITQPIDNRLRY